MEDEFKIYSSTDLFLEDGLKELISDILFRNELEYLYFFRKDIEFISDILKISVNRYGKESLDSRLYFSGQLDDLINKNCNIIEDDIYYRTQLYILTKTAD